MHQQNAKKQWSSSNSSLHRESFPDKSSNRSFPTVISQSQNNTIAEFVHDQLKGFILSRHYPCVGAKAAFNRNAYTFCFGETLGSSSSTQWLYRHLAAFVCQHQPASEFSSTFIVSFKSPNIISELMFEQMLWQQLQMLHDLDSASPWDTSVSDDPKNPRFSFSFMQKGFFVVGLHPVSSRWARRFAWPTLVFNAQSQFEALKANGKYHLMEDSNRRRDKKLQGSINPNLLDSSNLSEARQYSGRHVEQDWKCPFHRQ